MKILHYLLLFFSFLLLTTACRKEINETIFTTEEEDPVVLVRSNLRGKVVDEAGIGIQDVEVQVDGNFTTTDENGNFSYNNIEVKKQGSLVTADGQNFKYFKGASYSNFTAEGASYVQITMLERGIPFIIQSSTETIDFTDANDGLKVTIPANAIVDQNGNTGVGGVLYTKWLDPSRTDLGGIMPGELITTNEDGETEVLASFGMVAVDLTDNQGNPRFINEETGIEIELPIPNELLGQAPDEIPLWFFDLDEENWVKYGTCKKRGNAYVCKVYKSGYINCDIALPSICLSGQVFNSDSTHSAYLRVEVEDLTDNFVYWGYTDSLGRFCGSVPQGAELRLSIRDLCDSIIYTEIIGPFGEDTEIADIYLPVVVQTFLVNVSGSIMHCISNDVVFGHLSVRYPGKVSIYPISSGNINADIALKCVEFPNLEITAYSASQRNATSTIYHNNTSDVLFGTNIPTCEPLDDYFDINIDGQNYWNAPTQYEFKPNTTTNWLVLDGLSFSGLFRLELRDYIGVGQYTQNAFFETSDSGFLPGYYEASTTSSPDITVNITLDDGDYIEGNLSGQTTGSTGQKVDIDGTFRVRKAP